MKFLLLVLLSSQLPDAVTGEADPEKRYQLALDAASKSLVAARTSHGNGSAAETKANLEQAAMSTEFALKSLEAMGKQPFKNTKNYKKAELRTREFLRRIDALRKDASFEDRESLDSAYNRVSAVHETLIEGVMSKKQ